MSVNSFFKTLLLLGLSLLVVGCAEQISLDKYKQTYKQGLINLCGEEKGCKELIEHRFEQCLDDALVRNMIAAKPEEQDQLNKDIVEKTMACIVEHAEKESS